MANINLRDFYPFYQDDTYMEVPEELAIQLLQWKKADQAYERKRRWHHAYYSLDRCDGTQRNILFVADTPEGHYEKKMTREQLHKAFAILPEKQVKRIYAHYFLGLSKKEIAQSEGVCRSTITESITHGLKGLAKIIKNFS